MIFLLFLSSKFNSYFFLRFHDVRIPKTNLISTEAIPITMNISRLPLLSSSLAVIEKCALILHDYSNRRDIGSGRALSSSLVFQSCTTKISHYSTLLQTYLALLSSSLDTGIEVCYEAFIVGKILAPSFAIETCEVTQQFLGARGSMEDGYIEKLLRDIRVAEIVDGSKLATTISLGYSAMQKKETLKSLFVDLFHQSETIYDDFLSEILGLVSLEEYKTPSDYRDLVHYNCGGAISWKVMEQQYISHCSGNAEHAIIQLCQNKVIDHLKALASAQPSINLEGQGDFINFVEDVRSRLPIQPRIPDTISLPLRTDPIVQLPPDSLQTHQSFPTTRNDIPRITNEISEAVDTKKGELITTVPFG